MWPTILKSISSHYSGMKFFSANTDACMATFNTSIKPPHFICSSGVPEVRGCYRGILIFCFAFEFGHCFSLALPCCNQKPPPAFQTIDWEGIKYIHFQRTKETEQCENKWPSTLRNFLLSCIFSNLKCVFPLSSVIAI